MERLEATIAPLTRPPERGPSGLGDGRNPTTRLLVSRYHRILGLVAAIYVASAIPTLNAWSGEHQGWRQAQTADTARIFARTGIDLFHPRLSVFGPRAYVAFELPWYQALAAWLMRLGVPDMVALRVVAMTFTIVTALGVSIIAKRVGGERAGLWAAGLFLLNPFTMLWGRVSLIESFTTAAVLFWIIASMNSVARSQSRRRSAAWGLCAVVLGAVAATSKMTTLLPWVLVLVAAVRPTRVWRPAACAVLTGVPVAAGIAWTAWADQLKLRNLLTANLTSSAVHDGVFRTMSDRFDLATWGRIAARTPLFLGGMGVVLIAVGLRAMARRSNLGVGVALISVPITACMVFLGVYAVHDYYLSAITPAVCVVMGIGAHGLQQKLRGKRFLALLFVGVHICGFWLVSGERYGRLNRVRPAAVADLRGATWGDEEVLGVVLGYNPYPFFEADRHGTLIAAVSLVDDVSARLDTELGSPGVLWTETQRNRTVSEFLQQFDHIAAVGTHTYRFGQSDRLSEGPTAPLIRWDASDVSMTSPAPGPGVEVDCDGSPVTVAPDVSSLAIESPAAVWLGTDAHAAALPVRSGQLNSAKPILQVWCQPTGASPVTIRVRTVRSAVPGPRVPF